MEELEEDRQEHETMSILDLAKQDLNLEKQKLKRKKKDKNREKVHS